MTAHVMLEGTTGQLSEGNKGRLTARFAAMNVRAADGARQRIGSTGAHHMPGEEAWLGGGASLEWRAQIIPPISPLPPPDQGIRQRIKARRICEQDPSNSGKNWDGITSKADPGPDFTAMP